MTSFPPPAETTIPLIISAAALACETMPNDKAIIAINVTMFDRNFMITLLHFQEHKERPVEPVRSLGRAHAERGIMDRRINCPDRLVRAPAVAGAGGSDQRRTSHTI